MLYEMLFMAPIIPCALASLDRTSYIYDRPEDRKTLLFHALYTALSVNTHPWQGMHAHVLHLLDVEGAAVTRKHLLQAYQAFDRCQQDEERATYKLLLTRLAPTGIHRTGILEACCKLTTTMTDAPMRLLLDEFAIDKDTKSLCLSFARLAGKRGTCATLEACFERVAHIDTALSDALLLEMVHNQSILCWSRSLGNVLEQLLPCVTLDGVYRAFVSKRDGVVYTYLLEYLFLSGGVWTLVTFEPITRLDKSSLLWLLQRNPTLPVDTPCSVAWKIEFEEHQTLVRAALIAHTSLAMDLVRLVLQFV
jgi:hypothetical protein